MGLEKMPSAGQEDVLAGYIREVEKLKSEPYFCVVAATVAPGPDGKPDIIPMMVGAGLQVAPERVIISLDGTEPSLKPSMLDPQEIFLACLKALITFGRQNVLRGDPKVLVAKIIGGLLDKKMPVGPLVDDAEAGTQ